MEVYMAQSENNKPTQFDTGPTDSEGRVPKGQDGTQDTKKSSK